MFFCLVVHAVSSLVGTDEYSSFRRDNSDFCYFCGRGTMLRLDFAACESGNSWHRCADVATDLYELQGLCGPTGSDCGIERRSILEHLQETDLVSTLYENAGNVLSAVRKTFSIVFLSIFFMILLLASSFNGQRILEVLLLKNKTSSMRTYITIEKSISKFIFVKIIISLLTGISFSILCYCFDVQFPIFWGVLAFILNFIQMIGSIISTAIMCVFAVTFLPTMSVTVLFIVLAIAIQLLFGSILEPIFMGKTFSINTVTIIVMLFFWGYVWNIPGMILAVPLTVTMKTIMEQFDRTRAIAALMS